MMSINVQPLSKDIAFGARISGLTRAMIADETVRQILRDTFEERGLIVFSESEPTSQMHVELSNVFGPLKDHPVPGVARVNQGTMPGVINIEHNPANGGVIEIDGKRLSSWVPWHFDHCYNNELNRAGVLRALTVAPEGGLTMFADGIALYKAMSPDLLSAVEGHNVIYTLNLALAEMRFGRPDNFRVIQVSDGERDAVAYAHMLPRALHPAVWTRETGEKVLHVSPWMAAGIEGEENEQGTALLDAVCQEIYAKAKSYAHRWSLNDMLIWDNWRMIHAVSGVDPKHPRRMQRTTIKGDYGLGSFEHGGKGHKTLEMTV